MEGIYEKLEILKEMKQTIENVLNEQAPSTNTVLPQYAVMFYEEEAEDGKTVKIVGITFEFSQDTEIVPMLNIFEEIKKRTGCDDIFLDVGESTLVDSIKLYFKG